MNRLTAFKILKLPPVRRVHDIANGVDVVVVGGGIIGTATALTLKRIYPHLDVTIVEKESKLAAHQSGHNSGVIHAGIYYQPGSLKARLCVRGMNLAYNYLDQHGVPYKKVGKLIVAVSQSELAGLQLLYRRALQNQVSGVQLLLPHQFRQIAPHCQGVAAVWSPHTGIVDWGVVTRRFGDDFCERGGELLLNSRVTAIDTSLHGDQHCFPVSVTLENQPSIRCRHVICCAGLHSDRMAALSSRKSPSPRIVPFRGDYLMLRPDKCHLVNTNIYPVPNAQLPFLGVHFTPRMDGSVWLGPNAVWATAREGYSWRQICRQDIVDCIRYPGFRRIVRRHWRFGVSETIRAMFIGLQVRQLQRYIPHITSRDVVRGPSGVRAQALDLDGNLVDDFIVEADYAPAAAFAASPIARPGNAPAACRILHVLNAPSPAATSSLAIAELVVERAAEQFALGRDRV